MKKNIILIGLLIVSLFVLSGCNKEEAFFGKAITPSPTNELASCQEELNLCKKQKDNSIREMAGLLEDCKMKLVECK
ncbi:MAG: hypothetical protein ABH824_07645 [Nanoarchaeota archaeon]|nr:hypothetical protein [Nanoarchaeota archaeon]MBU1631646.1 hypothetical protein [Nanoarchaeota archaeon]MBU1875659.1 hypothetical protein [Nanoarchaeota archaeon]